MMSSDGIGGKTFSANINRAMPRYPVELMKPVIQSTI
jgi:hypothetical protein